MTITTHIDVPIKNSRFAAISSDSPTKRLSVRVPVGTRHLSFYLFNGDLSRGPRFRVGVILESGGIDGVPSDAQTTVYPVQDSETGNITGEHISFTWHNPPALEIFAEVVNEGDNHSWCLGASVIGIKHGENLSSALEHAVANLTDREKHFLKEKINHDDSNSGDKCLYCLLIANLLMGYATQYNQGITPINHVQTLENFARDFVITNIARYIQTTFPRARSDTLNLQDSVLTVLAATKAADWISTGFISTNICRLLNFCDPENDTDNVNPPENTARHSELKRSIENGFRFAIMANSGKLLQFDTEGATAKGRNINNYCSLIPTNFGWNIQTKDGYFVRKDHDKLKADRNSGDTPDTQFDITTTPDGRFEIRSILGGTISARSGGGSTVSITNSPSPRSRRFNFISTPFQPCRLRTVSGYWQANMADEDNPIFEATETDTGQDASLLGWAPLSKKHVAIYCYSTRNFLSAVSGGSSGLSAQSSSIMSKEIFELFVQNPFDQETFSTSITLKAENGKYIKEDRHENLIANSDTPEMIMFYSDPNWPFINS